MMYRWIRTFFLGINVALVAAPCLATQELRKPVTLDVHKLAVFSVAFSPNSEILASGSQDRTIKLWDTCKNREWFTLKGHADYVYSVAFSPDGKTLASGSGDQTIKLWEVATGKELITLKGHTGVVHSVTFSPDGKTLASGGFDKTIRIWDLATYQERHKFTERHSVTSVVFAPDGKTLASGTTGENDTIKLWDVVAGKNRKTLSGPGDWVTSLNYSADGKTIFGCSLYGVIKSIDVASGTEKAVFGNDKESIRCAASSPDGKTIITGGDGQIKLWDIATSKLIATYNGHNDMVLCVVFSPDGKTVASGSGGPHSGNSDTSIKLWSVASPTEK
jgi:WD40 repeat protein